MLLLFQVVAISFSLGFLLCALGAFIGCVIAMNRLVDAVTYVGERVEDIEQVMRRGV